MRLQSKIALVAVVSTAVAALLMAFINVMLMRDAVRAGAAIRLDAHAERADAGLAAGMARLSALAGSLAGWTEAGSGAAALATALAGVPGAVGVAVAAEDGHSGSLLVPGAEGAGLSRHPLPRAVAIGSGPTLLPAHAALPALVLVGAGGPGGGGLAVAADPRLLSAGPVAGPPVGLALMAGDGTVAPLSGTAPPPVLDADARAQLRGAGWLETAERVAHARLSRADADWLVVAAMPRDAAYAPLWRGMWLGLLVAASLVALAAVLAYRIGGRLLEPLHRLTRSLARRSAPSERLVFDPGVRDETGDLAREVAEAIDTLIRETTAEAQMVLAAAADAIVTIDDRGIVVSANPAAERLFGYPASEIIGAPVARLMPPEDAARHQGHVARSGTQALRRMAPQGREVLALHRDGSLVPVDIVVGSTRHHGRRHFVGVIRDVTERQQREAEREALIADLERSNAELDSFAYVATHDLKAPLRVIDNASQWLEEDLEPHLTEDTRESLALLRGRVRRMERLLDDLLAYSRIGRRAETATPVSGAVLAAELRDLLPDRPGIAVRTTPAFDALDVARMPLQTVVLNLVSNAVRHHDRPEGEVTLDAVPLPGGLAEITVTDDGPGIPECYHERIFGMFQTLAPRDRVDTSGMGLAIVRKHVELAGGRIGVESTGRGACFRFTWPVVRPPALESAA